MSILAGKKIVLGVSGGIAAYKALNLVREYRKKGAEVHVIMTENATRLVTPLAFRELSGQPVTVSMWAEITHWNVEHIALANLADIFVIAPATANIIGKMANGIADDMLSTTILATPEPVLVVPAMNTHMYEHPAVQANLGKLREFGYEVMEPTEGDLACGVTGKGRFPEMEDITFATERLLSEGLLKDKYVVVTAGGTREDIDPVRYIGNRSSGKMGYAVAKAAALQGARVRLVSATDHLPVPAGVDMVYVRSAQDMKQAVEDVFEEADIVIKAAAVADYRPAQAADQKIKKQADTLTLELVKNPDILYGLGQKKTHQILVGFAAETQNVLAYAKEKLQKKNLDMLVANDVSAPGAGFNTETNIVTMLFPDREPVSYDLLSKNEVAEKIIIEVADLAKKLQK